MTTADFEKALAEDITINRLRSLITAGVTVSDKEIRDQYRKQNVKIKFDYAVISSDDLRKADQPHRRRLAGLLHQERGPLRDRRSGRAQDHLLRLHRSTSFPAARPRPLRRRSRPTTTPINPNTRFPTGPFPPHPDQVPRRQGQRPTPKPKPRPKPCSSRSRAEPTSPNSPRRTPKIPAAARRAGNSALPVAAPWFPEFDAAIFSKKIGDVKLIHSQFGYHIVQVEERQTAHSQPLAEVEPTIQVQLLRQKEAQAESAYAQSLATEAAKNGLAKTAAAHHLEVVTTPSINAQGTSQASPTAAQVVAKAFAAKQGADPVFAPTGEGYAILQVTGITPAHAPTFADWKDKVAKDYADERLPQLLTEKTKELADKAQASTISPRPPRKSEPPSRPATSSAKAARFLTSARSAQSLLSSST
jgi:peptidyl-prolyl cis-trans isomerase D